MILSNVQYFVPTLDFTLLEYTVLGENEAFVKSSLH